MDDVDMPVGQGALVDAFTKRGAPPPADMVKIGLDVTPRLAELLEKIRAIMPPGSTIEDAAELAMARIGRDLSREVRARLDYLLDHGDAKHGASDRPTLFANRGVRAFYAQRHHPGCPKTRADPWGIYEGLVEAE